VFFTVLPSCGGTLVPDEHRRPSPTGGIYETANGSASFHLKLVFLRQHHFVTPFR
jgi:hypothetical protein